MNTGQEVQRWVISPRDARCHALAPEQTEQVPVVPGWVVVEAVCGHVVLGGAVIPVNVPRGAVCPPCEWGGAAHGDQPPGPGEGR